MTTDSATRSRWIETAAAWMGLEAEAVELRYADIQRHVHTSAPALLPLADGSFIVLLENDRVLAPDLSAKRIHAPELQHAIAHDLEQSIESDARALLDAAGVPARRRAKARAAVIGERLANQPVGVFWTVRVPPGANAQSIARRAGLVWRTGALLGAHTAEYTLWILSWWVVGFGALGGHFDAGWLTAWILLLLTMVPLRAVTVWLQGMTALTGGGLLKERLLAGALRLEFDDMRRQGAGRLLGCVIESEALESLALSGGFMSLISLVELIAAGVVLAVGAGGAAHSGLLVLWTAAAGLLGWRYYRKNREWTAERLHLTHDLVESMDGHRTRLAQESPEHRHESEDRELEHYYGTSRAMDRSTAFLAAVVPRGWLIIGVLGLAPAFVSGSGSPAQLAIGIGGMLLAWRALTGLTTGLWNLAGAVIAWQLVKPLFQAAARPERRGTPDLVVRTKPAPNSNRLVLLAQDLSFRYKERTEPTIRGCNVEIVEGDLLVLEGDSGCGKSTLGSVLAGLREPDSGVLLAGGLDHRTLGSDQWRHVVACAPQFHENHVLCAPFAFNLLMGRRGPLTSKDVEDADAVCRELGLGPLLDECLLAFCKWWVRRAGSFLTASGAGCSSLGRCSRNRMRFCWMKAWRRSIPRVCAWRSRALQNARRPRW